MNKQVVIRGGEGDWYEKAIFILKHNPPQKTTDLVNRANQIIGNYMKTQPLNESYSTQENLSNVKKEKWVDIFFYSSLVLFASVFLLYLI